MIPARQRPGDGAHRVAAAAVRQQPLGRFGGREITANGATEAHARTFEPPRTGNLAPRRRETSMDANPERARIDAASRRAEHWRRWGPYLSDRQWGTVREDYSADGNAWDYFPFEMARLRAYRWGEDGILGICDNHQRLCFAPAFWNERDEILKERFYGLGGHQGNHGEDVKEYWWYLEAVPSHAYLKALYRYPQRAFPYAQLREENARRGRAAPEFELIDTGVFAGAGSKAALHYRWRIEPGATRTVRLRITDDPDAGGVDQDFDATFARRADEADRFYAALARGPLDEDSAAVQRRAFAGMIWSKQFYNYVVRDWLAGDQLMPPPPESRKHGRNSGWKHLYNDDVLSMPDTWEYPWYAAWDLAFHVITFGLIDPEFAKRQLTQLTREWYMHPSGQLPAYEWGFDDVNPPVHAWAALRLYKIEAKRNGGAGDFRFLERTVQKLLMNFTWWVNRKDVAGRNVLQVGFLGLDNIGPFDRGRKLPEGADLAESDGTSWMAVYALNMLAIAIELAKVESIYEDIASKFFEHFFIISDAMNSERPDECGLWDPDDAFYYDQLYLPGGERGPVKIRSA